MKKLILAVTASPNQPAIAMVDYFLAFLGSMASRSTAKNETVKIVGSCKNAVDPGMRYFSYLLTFDVMEVIEGKFSEKEITFEVRPFSDETGLIETLKVRRVGGGFRCDPIPVILTFGRQIFRKRQSFGYHAQRLWRA